MSDQKPSTTTSSPVQSEPAPSRRDFLRLGWTLLAGIAAVEAGVIGAGFFLPRLAEGEFGSVFKCGPVDKFPPGSVTPFNEGRFYLVRTNDNGFLALYRKCTHLGCAVPWDQTKKQFICPCHASVFDENGVVLNPPAPRPLDLFRVSIVSGQVQVDTSQTIARDKFEKSQVVYP
ncbi:MAG: Rieske 2Fe-2S domain-containing protein [Anaerolineales bacterium]|nr:Rieske 2Fe-2S domain-containing protein [Anaerolineales bacterium]